MRFVCYADGLHKKPCLSVSDTILKFWMPHTWLRNVSYFIRTLKCCWRRRNITHMSLKHHEVNVNKPGLRGFDRSLEKSGLKRSDFSDQAVRNLTVWNQYQRYLYNKLNFLQTKETYRISIISVHYEYSNYMCDIYKTYLIWYFIVPPARRN